ncbi:MAG: DUF3788 domain-containing protein [bacterium]
MSKNNAWRRLLDEKTTPTEKKISATIGPRVSRLWKQLREFLKDSYDFQPELQFLGRKYGWCYKYRRKGKTLCVLFPETKAFTVLITLGKKEIADFEGGFSAFSKDTQKLFADTRVYHDGKWLYKRVLTKTDLDDVKSLITIKKKPSKPA